MDDDGHFTGDAKNTKFSLSQILYDVWKSLAEDYLITVVRLKKKQRKEKVKLLSVVMAAGVYILCMRLEVFSFLLQVYQWSIKPQNWYQNSSMGKLAPELRQTHPFEFHFWGKSGLFILQ